MPFNRLTIHGPLLLPPTRKILHCSLFPNALWLWQTFCSQGLLQFTFLEYHGVNRLPVIPESKNCVPCTSICPLPIPEYSCITWLLWNLLWLPSVCGSTYSSFLGVYLSPQLRLLYGHLVQHTSENRTQEVGSDNRAAPARRPSRAAKEEDPTTLFAAWKAPCGWGFDGCLRMRCK